jgi:hypothetical protein
MLEDMAVRKFSEATIRNYICHIAELEQPRPRNERAT